MSNPLINLNVRANTARALSDFKRFSDSLNNKFLVSGLKVELISSTLRQINNELQKSIGEQGLLGGSSMRAAQNQAAFLTSTFKNFSLEASKAINENMSKALSDVAVRAGGTIADIKKTMAGVSYISTNLSSGERTEMAKQIMSFQRDLRRAGVNDQFGDLASKFLSMGTTAQDMINSGDPLASKIGMTMVGKYKASYGQIYNAQMRTEILQKILNDPEINAFIKDQAKKTYGFKIYIEDLNTKLFNPESGLLGTLRKVTMSAGRTTSIFDETDKLVGSIFGERGVFVKFFRKLGQTFKVGDPLKVIISGIDFIGSIVKGLSKFMDSALFQSILDLAKNVWDKVTKTFKSIINNPTLNKVAELASNMFTNIVNMFSEVINSPIVSEIGRVSSETLDTILKIFKNILESPKTKELITISQNSLQGVLRFFEDVVSFSSDQLKKIDTAQVKSSLESVSKVFGTLTRIIGGIYNETTSGYFNSTLIISEMRQAGEGMRQFIKNIGKSIRGENTDKPAEFGSTIIGTLVEEVGKTTVVLFQEIFKTLIDKAPEIAGKAIPALNKAFDGMLSEVFGGFSGIIKTLAMAAPGPIGMLARGSTAASLTGGGGSLLGIGAIAGAAFLPQLLGMSRGGMIGRGLLGLGAGSMLGGNVGGLLGLTAAIAPMLFGGARGADRSRRGLIDNAARLRRMGPREYLYRRLLRDPGDRWKGGGGDGEGGTRSKFTMSRDAEEELREIERADRRERFSRGKLSSGFRYNAAGVLGRAGDSIGALRGKLSLGITPDGLADRDLYDFSESKEDYDWRMERDRRARRRFGVRGRIASMGRGIGRFLGGRGGKILALSGLVAGLGAMIGGGKSDAAENPELDSYMQEYQGDPEAMGELNQMYGASAIKKSQARLESKNNNNAAMSVLGGAANGAMTGAIFGPWGAAIGAVIGGGISLMDKGTRDGAIKWVKGVGKIIGDWMGSILNGVVGFGNSIKKALEQAASSFANSVQWVFKKIVNTLLDGLTFLPRLFTGVIEKIVNLVPKEALPGWARGALGVVSSGLGVAQSLLGARYSSGLNYYGPLMAQEARMSGGRAMVVNSREFVIPPDGFNTLAGLLENKIMSSSKNRGGESFTKVELAININNPVMLGNNKQLIDSLRKPVIDIVNDAYRRQNSARVRNHFIT